MVERAEALVVGAGPAGLMAAEALAAAGRTVIVAEAMPSPARKFLMAGKSGLNLTMQARQAEFLAVFPREPALQEALQRFDNAAVMVWAEALGQELFTGSTGRVFPRAMKASPLLRAWLARLGAAGVELRTRSRWTGWDGAALRFETPDGARLIEAGATVLALGGASWPRLGSDGGWAASLPGKVSPFAPANAGLVIGWSAPMAPFFGTPLKGIVLRAGGMVSRGEVVISARGLEGGGLYPLTPALRAGAALSIDLAPGRNEEELRRRLASAGPKASLSNRLRKAGLPRAAGALLREWAAPLPADLAPLLKALPVRHAGLRPLAEAISTAGGLRFAELGPDMMLKDRPGTFAAGEMLDWEAPTGGYLITACLATGRAAGEAAARFLGA